MHEIYINDAVYILYILYNYSAHTYIFMKQLFLDQSIILQIAMYSQTIDKKLNIDKFRNYLRLGISMILQNFLYSQTVEYIILYIYLFRNF